MASIKVSGKLSRAQLAAFLINTPAPIHYISRHWSDERGEEMFHVESDVTALDFFRKVEEESASEEGIGNGEEK